MLTVRCRYGEKHWAWIFWYAFSFLIVGDTWMVLIFLKVLRSVSYRTCQRCRVRHSRCRCPFPNATRTYGLVRCTIHHHQIFYMEYSCSSNLGRNMTVSACVSLRTETKLAAKRCGNCFTGHDEVSLLSACAFVLAHISAATPGTGYVARSRKTQRRMKWLHTSSIRLRQGKTRMDG